MNNNETTQDSQPQDLPMMDQNVAYDTDASDCYDISAPPKITMSIHANTSDPPPPSYQTGAQQASITASQDAPRERTVSAHELLLQTIKQTSAANNIGYVPDNAEQRPPHASGTGPAQLQIQSELPVYWQNTASAQPAYPPLAVKQPVVALNYMLNQSTIPADEFKATEVAEKAKPQKPPSMLENMVQLFSILFACCTWHASWGFKTVLTGDGPWSALSSIVFGVVVLTICRCNRPAWALLNMPGQLSVGATIGRTLLQMLVVIGAALYWRGMWTLLDIALALTGWPSAGQFAVTMSVGLVGVAVFTLVPALSERMTNENVALNGA